MGYFPWLPVWGGAAVVVILMLWAVLERLSVIVKHQLYMIEMLEKIGGFPPAGPDDGPGNDEANSPP